MNKKIQNLALGLIVASIMLGSAIGLSATTRDQKTSAGSSGSRPSPELQTVNTHNTTTQGLESSQAAQVITETPYWEEQGWDKSFMPGNFYNNLGDNFANDAIGSVPAGWEYISGDVAVADLMADSLDGTCVCNNPEAGHTLRLGGSSNTNSVVEDPNFAYVNSQPVLISFAAFAYGSNTSYAECSIGVSAFEWSEFSLYIGPNIIEIIGNGSVTGYEVQITPDYVHQIDIMLSPAVAGNGYNYLPIAVYVDGIFQFQYEVTVDPTLADAVGDLTFNAEDTMYTYLDNVWVGNPYMGSMTQYVLPLGTPMCYVPKPDVSGLETNYMFSMNPENVLLMADLGGAYDVVTNQYTFSSQLWLGSSNTFNLDLLSTGDSDTIVSSQMNFTVDMTSVSLMSGGSTYFDLLSDMNPVTNPNGSYQTAIVAQSAQQFLETYGYSPVDPKSEGFASSMKILDFGISGASGYVSLNEIQAGLTGQTLSSNEPNYLCISLGGGCCLGFEYYFSSSYTIETTVYAENGNYVFSYGLPNSGGLVSWGPQPYLCESVGASVGTTSLGTNHASTTTLTIIGPPGEAVYVSGLENFRYACRMYSVYLYLTENGLPSTSSTGGTVTEGLGSLPTSNLLADTMSVTLAGGGLYTEDAKGSNYVFGNSFTLSVYIGSTSNPPIAQISMTVYTEMEYT
jgi:hypothetical protein